MQWDRTGKKRWDGTVREHFGRGVVVVTSTPGKAGGWTTSDEQKVDYFTLALKHAAFPAKMPAYNVWLARGGGMIAASFSTSSTGENSIAVVPSESGRRRG